MTRVFADSFFDIALLNPADRYHAAARVAAGSLASPIVTTRWVLVEVADALSAPRVRASVSRLMTGIDSDPSTHVVREGSAFFDSGMKLYASRLDKSWSLTDCISFSVMTDFGLGEALTGDHHFEQAGFRALLKS